MNEDLPTSNEESCIEIDNQTFSITTFPGGITIPTGIALFLRDHWHNSSNLRSVLRTADQQTTVAIMTNTSDIAGVVIFDEAFCNLRLAVVHPEYRQRGIATALSDIAISQIEKAQQSDHLIVFAQADTQAGYFLLQSLQQRYSSRLHLLIEDPKEFGGEDL